jgi:hypothetical protein
VSNSKAAPLLDPITRIKLAFASVHEEVDRVRDGLFDLEDRVAALESGQNEALCRPDLRAVAGGLMTAEGRRGRDVALAKFRLSAAQNRADVDRSYSKAERLGLNIPGLPEWKARREAATDIRELRDVGALRPAANPSRPED